MSSHRWTGCGFGRRCFAARSTELRAAKRFERQPGKHELRGRRRRSSASRRAETAKQASAAASAAIESRSRLRIANAVIAPSAAITAIVSPSAVQGAVPGLRAAAGRRTAVDPERGDRRSRARAARRAPTRRASRRAAAAPQRARSSSQPEHGVVQSTGGTRGRRASRRLARSRRDRRSGPALQPSVCSSSQASRVSRRHDRREQTAVRRPGESETLSCSSSRSVRRCGQRVLDRRPPSHGNTNDAIGPSWPSE